VDTIATVAANLRRGKTSSEALIQQALAAIDADNVRVNAFVTVARDRAMAAARRADEERARGIDRGPLHGIPISIKDLIDEQGIVTTAGSTVLDDRLPVKDAEVVARLREAGAVIIGRTNLHQFAVGTTSEESHFGPVRNPHDTARSAGGSSGGAAAAVIAGMGLAAIGTDTGGSIRIPAAACGLVGLKATTGEIPNDGVIPMSVSLDHVGPLARSVQDAGWLCDVLAGRAPGNVVAAPAIGLRLTRLVGYFDALDPYVRASFEAALDRLRSLGVQTRTGTFPSSETISPTYINLALPETASWHAPYLDSRADRYVPAIHARISYGRTVSAVDYLAAKASAARLSGLVDEMLDGADALVLPTLPIPAPLLGQHDVVLDPSGGPAIPVRAAMLRHTQLFNLTTHPAITIPAPVSGLPVGLQLVGRRHDTARLLEIAAACEAALA
jgi:aspartyl-tRNA(Asn)/glutamyl-tRNA(Gln) amidotransferase subunit A